MGTRPKQVVVFGEPSLQLVDELAFRLPLADSLIAATARLRGACVVHRDKHRTQIPSHVLPTLDLAQV